MDQGCRVENRVRLGLEFRFGRVRVAIRVTVRVGVRKRGLG